MGQCISRRPVGVFTASSALVAQNSISGSSDQVVLVRNDSPSDEKQPQKRSGLTKGVAMSFGFRRKPPTSSMYAGNPAAARRLAANNDSVVDKNGNDDISSIPPSGRSTPKLVPPRKEPHSARVSRFGFRQPNNNRMNKIADVKSNIQPTHVEYNNKNENNNPVEVTKPKVTFSQNVDNKETSKLMQKVANKQPTKFTLQTSSLPRPQYAVRVMESKTAKTLANATTKKIGNQKKIEITAAFEQEEISSSKDEDSGVSSQENDSKSPTTSDDVIRKPRSLEVVLTNSTFDVRDVDSNSLEGELPIPKLPTAFDVHVNAGIVRERASEYERNLEKKKKAENLDLLRLKPEKTFSPVGRFLKSTAVNSDSTSASSDDHWTNAGEAMAEDFSLSSGDESRERTKIAEDGDFQRLLQSSFGSAIPKEEIRSVLLTIEDPKFAAVVAASNSSKLLQDEPSPTESLLYSYSESEEFKHKNNERRSSSVSKDVCCEKSSSSSPGTPTNASNSLSLSDGKDFLIDDEIADQPALVFDDNNQQQSENNTLIESTPKVKKKTAGDADQSPLFLKNRKKFLSRSDSVETLSTCESIVSDDLMLDYEVSQELGSDDRFDVKSCDGTYALSNELEKSEMRDWTVIVGQLDKQIGKHTNRTSRLLRSRGATPDSPRSLEGRCNSVRSRSSVAQSPLRLQSPRIIAIGSPTSYESDDSIKIERSCHTAMVQEVMGMKTMLLKLKRVLHEQADEEVLMRSETHNLFDVQRNGLFNGVGSEIHLDDPPDYKMELEDLKRQVLFLQGQVEDREKTVQQLQEQMTKLVDQNYTSKSAPASTICVETSNAATQTERIRPTSAGPSLLSGTTTEGNSLVSVNEESRSPRMTRHKEANRSSPSLLKPPNKLWRKPAENSSPQKTPQNSSIPRRSASRPRRPVTPS